ncbi:hypothetical protein V6N13_129230 [Hibiscus sabdariffa]|uniref:Uncharacterized protein n=1 Tax=Hibiscus sabdariffa TaxID=183260 RepID=A0ABR2SLF5_9ROSI
MLCFLLASTFFVSTLSMARELIMKEVIHSDYVGDPNGEFTNSKLRVQKRILASGPTTPSDPVMPCPPNRPFCEP